MCDPSLSPGRNDRLVNNLFVVFLCLLVASRASAGQRTCLYGDQKVPASVYTQLIGWSCFERETRFDARMIYVCRSGDAGYKVPCLKADNGKYFGFDLNNEETSAHLDIVVEKNEERKAIGSCFTRNADCDSPDVDHVAKVWNPNTLESVCDTDSQSKYHIALLCISFIFGFPAAIIMSYFCWSKSRPLMAVHRNLVMALSLRTFFTLLLQTEVILDAIKGSAVLSENGAGCQTLAVFETFFLNLVLSFWLVEAIYTWKFVSTDYKEPPNVTLYSYITSGLSLLFTIIWIIVMATAHNETCWVGVRSWVQWINEPLRIIFLILSLLLLGDILRKATGQKNTTKNDFASVMRKEVLILVLLTPFFILQFSLIAGTPTGSECMEAYFYTMYTIDGIQCIVVAVVFFYLDKESHSAISELWGFQKGKELNSGSPIRTLDSLRENRFENTGATDNNDVVYSSVLSPDRYEKVIGVYQKASIGHKNSVTVNEGEAYLQCQDERKLSTISEYYDAASLNDFYDAIGSQDQLHKPPEARPLENVITQKATNQYQQREITPVLSSKYSTVRASSGSSTISSNSSVEENKEKSRKRLSSTSSSSDSNASSSVEKSKITKIGSNKLPKSLPQDLVKFSKDVPTIVIKGVSESETNDDKLVKSLDVRTSSDSSDDESVKNYRQAKRVSISSGTSNSITRNDEFDCKSELSVRSWSDEDVALRSDIKHNTDENYNVKSRASKGGSMEVVKIKSSSSSSSASSLDHPNKMLDKMPRFKMPKFRKRKKSKSSSTSSNEDKSLNDGNKQNQNNGDSSSDKETEKVKDINIVKSIDNDNNMGSERSSSSDNIPHPTLEKFRPIRWPTIALLNNDKTYYDSQSSVDDKATANTKFDEVKPDVQNSINNDNFPTASKRGNNSIDKPIGVIETSISTRPVAKGSSSSSSSSLSSSEDDSNRHSSKYDDSNPEPINPFSLPNSEQTVINPTFGPPSSIVERLRKPCVSSLISAPRTNVTETMKNVSGSNKEDASKDVGQVDEKLPLNNIGIISNHETIDNVVRTKATDRADNDKKSTESSDSELDETEAKDNEKRLSTSSGSTSLTSETEATKTLPKNRIRLGSWLKKKKVNSQEESQKIYSDSEKEEIGREFPQNYDSPEEFPIQKSKLNLVAKNIGRSSSSSSSSSSDEDLKKEQLDNKKAGLLKWLPRRDNSTNMESDNQPEITNVKVELEAPYDDQYAIRRDMESGSTEDIMHSSSESSTDSEAPENDRTREKKRKQTGLSKWLPKRDKSNTNAATNGERELKEEQSEPGKDNKTFLQKLFPKSTKNGIEASSEVVAPTVSISISSPSSSSSESDNDTVVYTPELEEVPPSLPLGKLVKSFFIEDLTPVMLRREGNKPVDVGSLSASSDDDRDKDIEYNSQSWQHGKPIGDYFQQPIPQRSRTSSSSSSSSSSSDSDEIPPENQPLPTFKKLPSIYSDLNDRPIRPKSVERKEEFSKMFSKVKSNILNKQASEPSRGSDFEKKREI